LVVLLSVPVDVRYRLRIRNGLEGRLTIAWLFGLIRIPVHLDGDKAKKRAAKRRKKKARRRKKARPGGRANVFLSADFWRWLRRLLRKLMNKIRIYRLFLRVRLGLDDPADTGRLWALAGPVAALMANIPLAEMRLEPNFMEAELEMESEGEIRIYPMGLIATVVATLLSPTTWRVFRQRGAG
jgi:hypothetical protein